MKENNNHESIESKIQKFRETVSANVKQNKIEFVELVKLMKTSRMEMSEKEVNDKINHINKMYADYLRATTYRFKHPLHAGMEWRSGDNWRFINHVDFEFPKVEDDHDYPVISSIMMHTCHVDENGAKGGIDSYFVSYPESDEYFIKEINDANA
jgi:hypothetical protein